jgi:hypothetical protein
MNDRPIRLSRASICPDARAPMVHRIEEYARQRGHADLLRERIDGRVRQ